MIPSHRGTLTIRAKRGKKDIVVTSKNIEVMLTVKGQDEVLGEASRPTTPKKAKRRFMGGRFH